MSTDPQLGSIVEIPVGQGVVRFSGTTSFAAGKWVGIELNDANGKNNGTIGGIAYFSCKPNYGVFVRPSQVKVIGNEREAQASGSVSAFVCHENGDCIEVFGVETAWEWETRAYTYIKCRSWPGRVAEDGCCSLQWDPPRQPCGTCK